LNKKQAVIKIPIATYVLAKPNSVSHIENLSEFINSNNIKIEEKQKNNNDIENKI
jgi:hypothetical protein